MAKYDREIVLPPEAMRHPIRFQLDAIRNHVIGRVIRTGERGLNGAIDKDKAASVAIGLKAYLALLDRVAPVPKAEVNVSQTSAPIVIQWDTSRQEIAPPGDRSAPSSGFSNGSNGSTYWSAIEGGERPPSA